MPITALGGALVIYGTSKGEETGPSLSGFGWGLADQRPGLNYQPGQAVGSVNACFAPFGGVMTLNITPSAKSATAIAAAQHTVSGTALTPVSSSGSGIVVDASVPNLVTGVVETGLLAIGQASARVDFGQGGTIQGWDPSTLTARTLLITCSSASGTGGTFTVKGYDIYGAPMSEAIVSAPASSTTVSGLKAWKYISSITPNFTDATYNYSVGTNDVFGLPLASNYFGDVSINYPSAVITASTGYLAGVNTLATASTGDVRGTYALQAASDGSKRLIVIQYPLLNNLGLPNGVSGSSTGLFGVTQD
jgi:hypothetical protein